MFNTIKANLNFLRSLWLLLMLMLIQGCGLSSDPQSLIDSAVKNHETGDYRAAMIELKSVLQDSPDNARARLELGKLYVSMEQIGFAEKELLRAQELGIPNSEIVLPLGQALLQQRDYKRLLREVVTSPSTPGPLQVQILLLRGNAYLGLDDFEKADAVFNKVQSLDPSIVDALVGLAKSAIKQKNLAAADQFITGALSIDPKSSSTWQIKGNLEYERKNIEAAENAFAEAVKIESNKPHAGSALFLSRLGLTQMQLMQKKNEEASKNIELMLKTTPTHPTPKYFKALLAYQSGSLDDAVLLLQEALNADNNNASALMLMGTIKFAQGNWDQADMYLSTLLNVNSNHIPARKLLAAARMKMERPELALETLEQVDESGVGDAGYLALSGAAHLKMGNYEAGINYLEQAVETEPNSQILLKELVISYIRAGKLDSAVELLEKSLSGKGDEGDYRKELIVIQTLLLGKDKERALKRAESLLEKRPDDPLVNNIIGGIMATMERYSEASVYLNKAVELSPDFESALMNLGRLAQVQGQTEEATRNFEHLLKINPNNSTAMLHLAQALEAAEKQEEALQWLEKARSVDPQAVVVRLVLARFYIAKKDFQQAREIAVEAYKIAPQRLDTLEILGASQLQLKDYKEAIVTLKKAVALSPESVGILFNLARAQLASNEIAQSTENLRKVIRLSPEHSPSVILLTTIEAKDGNTSEALKLLSKQQEIDGENSLLYVLEGDIHLSTGQFKDAIIAYQNAWKLAPDRKLAINMYTALKGANMDNSMEYLSEWLDMHPDDVGIRATRAQAYQQKGDLAKAISDYEYALKLAPDNTLVLNNLAWMYYEKKDSRAIGLAEKAHNISPDVATIADTLGWLLVESGEHERGLELLKKAAEQAPGIPEIHYHLAVAYAKTGDSDEAKKIMNQAIKADNNLRNFPYAKGILQSN